MSDTFRDPDQIERLQKQKMDAMKVLMSEIIDNPSLGDKNQLKQVIDYLDKPTTVVPET